MLTPDLIEWVAKHDRAFTRAIAMTEPGDKITIKFDIEDAKTFQANLNALLAAANASEDYRPGPGQVLHTA